MPIYVWKCAACDAIVEELRKVGDDEPPKSCDGCRKDCVCEGKPCEFIKQLTSANFRIDPAAG